jgi:hypothetical protein
MAEEKPSIANPLTRIIAVAVVLLAAFCQKEGFRQEHTEEWAELELCAGGLVAKAEEAKNRREMEFFSELVPSLVGEPLPGAATS